MTIHVLAFAKATMFALALLLWLSCVHIDWNNM